LSNFISSSIQEDEGICSHPRPYRRGVPAKLKKLSRRKV